MKKAMWPMLILTIALTNPGFAAKQKEAALPEAESEEMVARLLRIGMTNSRSDREADQQQIVCDIWERPGSKIKDLVCGTNASLNREREKSLQSYGARGRSRQSKTDDNAREMSLVWFRTFGSRASHNDHGPLLTIQSTSRGQVQSMIDAFTAEENDEENRQKLLEGLTRALMMDADGLHDSSASDYTAFILAYRKIGELETQPFESDAALENAMVQAIKAQGLSIPEYNSLLDKVMSDEQLRNRVLVALKIEL